MSDRKQAVLYRMETDAHICPFGLKSRDLLRKKGFEVEDNTLDTRAQTDAFQEEHDVDTTPQTFIDGKRIGGYDDLRKYFGLEPTQEDDGETTYQPVIAVFATAFAMALAGSWASNGDLIEARTLEWFIAFSMCILAILKLRDLESFSNQFLGYDLLAQRAVGYAYVYPFGEAVAGILMIAGGAFVWLAAPVALFIGTIGAVSVFKAVYIDKRELNCACVGGGSNVPLGAVSLTENVMMAAMAIWMVAKQALAIG